GDGGDELFCGYERHVALQRLRHWRWLAAMIPSPLLPRRDPKAITSKLARLGVAARGAPNSDLAAIFSGPDLAALTGDRLPSGPVDDPGHWDAQFYLGPDLLRKTDTASMAVALEVRAPFLQRDLATAALAEPLSSLMPRGQRKGLLKAVARKYLPDEIVDRPKQGFAIPISDWFRSDYGGMRQLLLDHLTAPDPFPGLEGAGVHLNMAFVRRMLKEHDDAGEKSLWPWKGRDHGQRLYMLLVLSIWCRWLERIRQGG
ncbi:MAG: asparagine synthase, partial [Phycisphaerales bacterium]|nr:asparagine synthase [Phycisphaerales bacterium]